MIPGKAATAWRTSDGEIVSSFAQSPRLARLEPPSAAKLPDQFSCRVCDPPGTRDEVTGNVTLPVPDSVVETSAVSGVPVNSPGVM